MQRGSPERLGLETRFSWRMRMMQLTGFESRAARLQVVAWLLYEKEKLRRRERAVFEPGIFPRQRCPKC